MSQKYFVQLQLGSTTYKDQVSTAQCSNVAEFKEEIKRKFSKHLSFYEAYELKLFQLDGTTEIDPETTIGELKEVPWKPMIVKVDEVEQPATQPTTSSSKKQLTYKGMSVEASCRKYLDALARKIALSYDFHTEYSTPTMGDVLKAKDGVEGRDWDYALKWGKRVCSAPLPDLYSAEEWNELKSLNKSTTLRIHDGVLPTTREGKQFIILSHDDFKQDRVDRLKRIATIVDVVFSENDLIVKEESALSGSSGSECSPTK